MPPRRTLPVTVILAAALLSACTPPSAPTPAPTPTPTFSCVPEAGGDPVPCGPIEYEQAQKRDALYAEAESVYRNFWDEYMHAYTLTEPSVSGALQADTMGTFRGYLDAEFAADRYTRRVSGSPVLVRVGRLPGLSRAGSVVALQTCYDASQSRYLRPDGGEVSGAIIDARMYFALDAGSLKITDAEAKVVQSC